MNPTLLIFIITVFIFTCTTIIFTLAVVPAIQENTELYEAILEECDCEPICKRETFKVPGVEKK